MPPPAPPQSSPEDPSLPASRGVAASPRVEETKAIEAIEATAVSLATPSTASSSASRAATHGTPTPRSAALLASLLPPTLALGALLAVWSLLAVGRSPLLLPGPGRVLAALWRSRESLLPAAGVTLLETGLGLLLAFCLALPIALGLTLSPGLRRALHPLLVASQTVQVLAVAPLLVIWFGFGLFPKVLVVALACFFPLAVSLADGFLSLDPAYLDLFAVLGARPWQTWWRLRLPAALPAFFSGLKIAVTYGVVSATIGEWVGGSQGLGLYLLRAKNALQVDQVFGGMLLTSLLSMALYAIAALAERRALAWRLRL